jgi:hypothetical protein
MKNVAFPLVIEGETTPSEGQSLFSEYVRVAADLATTELRYLVTRYRPDLLPPDHLSHWSKQYGELTDARDALRDYFRELLTELAWATPQGREQ